MTEKRTGTAEEISTLTLQTVAEDFDGEDLDLVKADIEGSEMAMLEGAAPLFSKRKIGSLQVEYNNTWLRSGRRLKELFDFANDHGYTVLTATPLGLTTYPRYASGLEDYRLRNIVLAREDHREILCPIGPAGRARVESMSNLP